MRKAHSTTKLGKVIKIDEAQVQEHLGEVVRGTVEETLNAMLDAEAEQLVQAKRYERTTERKDHRAGTSFAAPVAGRHDLGVSSQAELVQAGPGRLESLHTAALRIHVARRFEVGGEVDPTVGMGQDVPDSGAGLGPAHRQRLGEGHLIQVETSHDLWTGNSKVGGRVTSRLSVGRPEGGGAKIEHLATGIGVPGAVVLCVAWGVRFAPGQRVRSAPLAVASHSRRSGRIR